MRQGVAPEIDGNKRRFLRYFVNCHGPNQARGALLGFTLEFARPLRQG
jgi:cell division FtsZ-interacting protein ZapD